MTAEDPRLKKAREIWNSVERARGVYHPNDKGAYLNAFAAALPVMPSEDEIKSKALDWAISYADEKHPGYSCNQAFQAGVRWLAAKIGDTK